MVGSFYFVYLGLKPINVSLCVYFFGNIRNIMTYYAFDRVFVDIIFLSHCNELFSTIMRTVLWIKVECFYYFTEPVLIFIVGQSLRATMCMSVGAAEQITTPKFRSLLTKLHDKWYNSLVNRYHSVCTGTRLNPPPCYYSVGEIDVLNFDQSQFLWAPT